MSQPLLPSPTPFPIHHNPTTPGTLGHWKTVLHTSQPTEHPHTDDQQRTPIPAVPEQAIHLIICSRPHTPLIMMLPCAPVFPLCSLAPELCQRETHNLPSSPPIRSSLPPCASCLSLPLQDNLRGQLSRPALLSAIAPRLHPSLATKRASGKPPHQKTEATGTRETRKGEPAAPAGSSRSRLR